jgi:hypothetical protein
MTMTASAFSIALLILAAPPSGSIGIEARQVRESGDARRLPIEAPSEADGRIGHPSYVFHSVLDDAGDLNGDRWPDGWRRRVGPGYPSHLAMSLVADPTAPGGHCLRVQLNGGGAAAYSPPVLVSPDHAYTVTATVKTQQLQYGRACIAWRLLDADQKPIVEHLSARVGGDTPWRELTLVRQASDDPRVRFAEVGWYVQSGDRADLAGSVSLADVRVIREPRLQVTTGQARHSERSEEPHAAAPETLRGAQRDRLTRRAWNLFDDPQAVTIECRITGLAGAWGGRSARLVFELIDISQPLGTAGGGSESTIVHAADLAIEPTDPPSKPHTVWWSPRLPGPGCYRLRTWLEGHDDKGRQSGRSKEPGATREVLRSAQDDRDALRTEQETMLAVLPPGGPRVGGSFGWSLPGAAGSPLPPQLAELAQRLGVGAVKLPLWLDEKDDARRQAAHKLVEELRSRDVRIIGVLGSPAGPIRKALFDDPTADGSVANLLTAPAAKLRPRLTAAIMPWALRVHDWQLGEDGDGSLRGSSPAIERLHEVAREMADDGLAARWALPQLLVSEPARGDSPQVQGQPSTAPAPPWDEGRGEGQRTTASLFVPSLLSAPDVAAQLSTRRSASQPAWVTIEPPAGDASPGQRVADFTYRLVAAAASGAGAVFVHDPFDPSRGLFQADGSPGELLVPWCTAARQLSGGEYVGRLHLPGGSENRVFQRDGEVSIVVWGRQPATEPACVGPQARQVDVWGRTTTPPLRGHEQLIAVGPVPSFVIGGDAAVVRTQLAVQVEPSRLPSVASAPHTITLRLPNCFGRRVTGQATVRLPDRWRMVSAPTAPFDLPVGGEARLPFRVRMPFDGASGPQLLRLEVEVAADKPYRFTVYRQLEAGLGDVELTCSARLDERGDLLVRQVLTNRGTADVSFACQLLIPGRRPQQVAVRRLPPGVHEHVYTVPEGAALVGKTLRLRADELGGQRVLSQSLVP